MMRNRPVAPGRPVRRLPWALAALLSLLGCDQERIAQLEEGVATEADVRQQFGVPEIEYPEADGSRTLAFPRQPEGRTNYMITIGPDGRMSALRQVLKPADFAKVRPGMSREEVRRLLGRPGKQQVYAANPNEDWSWFWLDRQEKRVHIVTFNPEGRVLSSVDEADMRDLDPGR